MSVADKLEERLRDGAVVLMLDPHEAVALIAWVRAWERMEAVPATNWRETEASVRAVADAYAAFLIAVECK
ncbi:MAG TPA: hypothetical protein VFT98_23065 [Myxococcota bacterium]|nr:hypothetical protein [Myxococcota bacterium]